MKKITSTANKIREQKDRVDEKKAFGAKPKIADKPGSPSARPTELAISLTDSSVADAGELEVGAVGDDNDDDSVIIARTRPEIEPVPVFELEKCTTIVFIDLEGGRTEVLLDKRILVYSDLQREIAKRTPKTQKMYVIQDEKGRAITAQYFLDGEDTTILRVKEIGIHPFPPGLKGLKARWEVEEYHEVRTQKSSEAAALVPVDPFSDEEED